MSDSGADTVSGTAEPYRVLARKYRPADFTSLIGQEPMVRTLTNAFKTGRIAQAWMLTGVRGVGKTTTARILARALNYKTEEADAPTTDLATFGEHCQAIMEGRHVDVIEMDAASHTGIDDIRDIIDRVRYAPVSARYKVYIIDEVHMLSNQAFNGLLKTLEEPPPHVKFIFATTEIRKVPITVLSRCQRFDLRRVEAATLVSHLKEIANSEGIDVETEALSMIARAAEGSVRDSLSILDQAIAHSDGKVTGETVRSMLGLADKAQIIDLYEHVMKGETAAALALFRDLYNTGADPVVILTGLASFNHLVTRLRFVEEAAKDPSLNEDEVRRGSEFAGKLKVPVLSRCWQMLLKGITEVQNSPRPVDAAEMVLVRLTHAADLPTLDAAIQSLEDGSVANPTSTRVPTNGPAPDNGGGGATAQARVMPQAGGPAAGPAMRLVAPAAAANPPVEASKIEPDTEDQPVIAITSISDIVKLADEHRDMAFKVLVRRCVRPVSIVPGRIEVSLTDEAPKTLLGDLTKKLTQWTGARWVAMLSRETGSPTLHEMEENRRESVFEDARQDPTVAAILEKFPGSKIIDVRLNETDNAELNGFTAEPEEDD